MATAPQMGILALSTILCPSQSPFHLGMISRQAAGAWEARDSLELLSRAREIPGVPEVHPGLSACLEAGGHPWGSCPAPCRAWVSANRICRRQREVLQKQSHWIYQVACLYPWVFVSLFQILDFLLRFVAPKGSRESKLETQNFTKLISALFQYKNFLLSFLGTATMCIHLITSIYFALAYPFSLCQVTAHWILSLGFLLFQNLAQKRDHIFRGGEGH